MSSTTSEREHGMISHLEELRQRIIYAMVALSIGVVAGWFLYPHAYHLVADPLLIIIRNAGGEVFTKQPSEAFFTQCKLAAVLGLVLASPVIIWQLWLFVRPGLTLRERKAVGPLMPVVSILFIAGIALAYILLPRIITFFVNFVPTGVSPDIDFQSSIDLPLKVMLGFGLAFQIPVLILGAVALGLVTPIALLRQWRTAIVVMALIAAIITPTPDPLTMSLMLIPLLILYFGTVLIAFQIVKKQRRESANI